MPPENIAELGKGKKPPVKVTLNGFTYATTVAAFGDVYMIPLSKERREAAGVQAGDTVEVTLELDTEPRTVTIPEDLAAASTPNRGRGPPATRGTSPPAKNTPARSNPPKPKTPASDGLPKSSLGFPPNNQEPFV